MILPLRIVKTPTGGFFCGRRVWLIDPQTGRTFGREHIAPDALNGVFVGPLALAACLAAIAAEQERRQL